jgi:SpoVK/Ycf46/Vps4 family AAA+-type ATPase
MTGNPGTGKSTLGKILSDLLWAYDVLPERKFVRVVRSDLIGQYIGSTEARVKKILESVLGGVVLMDEAHNLYASKEDSRDFAHDAMGEINDFLEEHKNEFLMIMTGHREGIKLLMTMQDGLESRFPTEINLEDYNAAELVDIFNLKAAERGIRLQSPDMAGEISRFLEKKKDIRKERFANGRDARNLVENFQGAIRLRLYKEGKIPSQPDIAAGASYASLEDLQTVTPEDMKAVLRREESRIAEPGARKIGFR